MSNRSEELEVRRAELLLRCATQRRAVAEQFVRIETRLGTVDRAAGIAQRIILNPVVVVTGTAALLMVGHVRGLRMLGRLTLLASAARRLWRVAKAF